MARKNSDNDNAYTDKRKEGNTSQALSRNEETKNKLLEQWKKDTQHFKMNKDRMGDIARINTRTDARPDKEADAGIDTRTQAGNDEKGK